MNKLIKTLQEEENKLLDKLQKASNENNFSDYKMLIRNLTEITRLKNEEIRIHRCSQKVLYFDVGYNNSDKTSLYFDNKIYTLENCDLKDVVNKIKEITNNCDVTIYGDIRGIGMVLADYLYEEGYIVESTIIEAFNPKKFKTTWAIEQDYKALRNLESK